MIEGAAQKRVGTFDGSQIDFYWNEIVPLIEDVPGFSEFFSPEFAYSRLQQGDWQIWALSDSEIHGVVITEIRIYPRAKVFHILAAAGNFLEFFDEMEATFEWLARDANCTYIQAAVRPGLERKLKRDGLRRQVILTRRVTEGTQ